MHSIRLTILDKINSIDIISRTKSQTKKKGRNIDRSPITSLIDLSIVTNLPSYRSYILEGQITRANSLKLVPKFNETKWLINSTERDLRTSTFYGSHPPGILCRKVGNSIDGAISLYILGKQIIHSFTRYSVRT